MSSIAPSKVTAKRLAKVEEIQSNLLACARSLEDIAEEEKGEWTVGSPTNGTTARVRPLGDLARRLRADIDSLERLYS